MKLNGLVEEEEHKSLLEYIYNLEKLDSKLTPALEEFKQDLLLATRVSEKDFPENCIRLNSIVDLDTPFGIMKVQLVLPKDSKSTQKRISVFSPMGVSLFAFGKGEEVDILFPNGNQIVKIAKVTN
jgi:regulator of nucleoside diphosphate kinase